MRKSVPVRQQKRESTKTGRTSVFGRRNASAKMSPITESMQFSQKQGQILQLHKQKLEESHQILDKLRDQLSSTQKRMSHLQSEMAREKFLFELITLQSEEIPVCKYVGMI